MRHASSPAPQSSRPQSAAALHVQGVVLAAGLCALLSLSCSKQRVVASASEISSKTGAFQTLAGPDVDNPGVQLEGKQIIIRQVTPKTCLWEEGKIPFTVTGIEAGTGEKIGTRPGSLEKMFYVPDGPAHAYLDQQGRTRLIFPHLLSYAFVGSSIEDVQLDCSDPIYVSNYNPDPNMLDSASWPWAVYRLPDQSVVSLLHMEHHAWAHPGNCPPERSYFTDACPWYSAITWAIARDGIHFTSPPAPSHVVARAPGVSGYPRRPPVGIGYSDHTGIMRNPKDGKYYVTSLTRGLSSAGGTDLCMMRTDDLLNPASWKVLTGGTYSGSAVNGSTCDALMPTGFVGGSLSWSTFYNKAVLLTFAHPPGRETGFYMLLAQDDELTRWSDPVLVMAAQLPWGNTGDTKNAPSQQYPSFVPKTPSATGNFDVLGEEAYLFYTRNFAGDITNLREIIRAPIRFTKGTGEIRNTVSPPLGIYRVAGGAWIGSAQGGRCSITSPAQLSACGWAQPFNELPEFKDHSNSQDDGQCTCGRGPTFAQRPDGTLVTGCYRVGAAGFYSNASGQSCGFLGPFQRETCGGEADFAKLPERSDHGANALQGGCRLPKGCYRSGGAGFYANDAGKSCSFLDVQMAGICGTGDFFSLKELPSHGGNDFQGACAGSAAPNPPAAPPSQPAQPQTLPQGCYRLADGSGYYANASGKSCALLGPHLAGNCGTADFNALTLRSDHGANQLQGACTLPQGCYRVGGGGYFANNAGKSCGLSGDPQQMQGICSTTNFFVLKELPSHGGNELQGACGG